MKRFITTMLLCGIAAIFAPPEAQGQGGGKTVAVTVSDELGEVAGANVSVKGTTIGNITDADGRAVLNNVPADATLVVSYIGYVTQEIPVGGRAEIAVTLVEDTQKLDEVVVTALGIKREKKALGYAIQEIKAESMSENRSESVANMLQGKVAGVQISQSATGVGGSTRIVLRGTTSLSGNNQPLWVVDGIPISDNQTGSASQWGGIDYSGSASEINPEDIESISVLKGANAAAMYGSRAQNGAIIVTTKKGKSGKLQLEYNGNLHFSDAYDSYKYQNIYGQGSGGTYSVGATESWGPKMEGQMVDNWRGPNGIYKDSRYDAQNALSPQKNYVDDFYRTGVNYTNTLTASGGSDNLAARFSFSDSRNEGITPGHTLNKQYYDLNTSFTSRYLDIDAKVNFMRQKGRNRPALGEYGIMKSLIIMPRGIRLSDLKDPVGLDGYTVNWSGQSIEFRNPYTDTMDENGNKDERNRIIGKVQLVGKITDYLKVTGRVGIDWYHDEIRNYSAYAQDETSTSYSKTMATNEEFNADLMVNFDKKFNDFSVLANAGTATASTKWSNISGSSGYFSIPRLIALGNGNNQTTSEGYSKKRVNSLLGNATLGYKSMAYIDVTARNDWSSTLPSDNWSYFYPSVSLSAIMTEILNLPRFMTYWKLRGSFAKVGNDTSPYRLLSIYSLDKTNGDIINATAATTFPLSDLKPEDTRSYEFGTELRLFGSRLGLDLTYYNANTINQILEVTVPISSGYSSKLINAGKMKSYGWEASLTGSPISTDDLTWDVTLNWGLNRTECVSLDPNLKRFIVGETRIGKVVVDEGGKYGDIVGVAYKRDENGRKLINDNGLPITESEKVVGNMTPDWTGSVSTALRWKNLFFNALVDIRCGGDLISTTDLYASTAGTSERTLAGREEGLVVEGIVESTGLANTKTVSAQSYWSAIGGPYGVAEEFLYDASYAKVREMSLGYALPKKLLKGLPVQSVKISAVGRDLFYIFKNAPVNPESSFSREDYAQAFEYSAMPSTRSYGFTLNVKF